MSIAKNGTPITSLEEWETLAGPERTDQWVDGRRAKEAARAWLEAEGGALPKEIATLLKRHDAFGPVLSWSAEPQMPQRIDAFPDEPRNSDLVVEAEDAHGKYLIAVEAKADEPFGETMGDTLAAAVDRWVEDDRSNGSTRASQLAKAMLGPRSEDDPPLKDIRYQLLTACAGCLCEAERRGHARALLLIQEFVTDRTVDKKLLINAIDLGRFVKRLSHGAAKSLVAGEIHGPFEVPGAPLVSAKIDFYLGKVSRNIRSRR